MDTQASSIAGIIAAFGSLITAVGAIYLASRQQTLNAEMRKNSKATNETLHIVNSERTAMQNFQRALIRELKLAGIAVPVDQSLDDLPDLETPPPPLVMEEVNPPEGAEPMLMQEKPPEEPPP